ncbi:MAG TPA: Mur ligase family protein [Thermoanaerobaculia bacterium]|nr:Mur ligase family protein [Thermoanaerobaculia bacterium]
MDLYFIAIGGTGMAPLACLLAQQGHRIRGSDGPLYPPMSDLLADAGIEPLVGFDPAHLDPSPELVIVGNAVPRHNVEAVETERLGLPRISMPEAIARFLLAGREPLVVVGTHGKTTTSSMAAWVWAGCGQDPGFLIGGVPAGFGSSFQLGSGRRFVVEGDEYNAAYFDRGPKFLHYRPQTLLFTHAELDHTDLYRDEEELFARFAELIAGLPPDGRLVACWDQPAVRRLASAARCPLVRYGLAPGADVVAEAIAPDAEGTRFEVASAEGRCAVRLPLWGRHNVSNALAVWAAARGDGLEPEAIAAALATFGGVLRRLEELGEAAGVRVVDDFAHHPTEVAASIEGLRARYPGRRLRVLFEPRSLTAGRRQFSDAYLEAFAGADEVLLAPVFHRVRLGADQALDLEQLGAALRRRGIAARHFDSVAALRSAAVGSAQPGEVLTTMSSGSFEGLPRLLLADLRQRSGPR